MRSARVLRLLLVFMACGIGAAHAGGKASARRFAEVTVRVSGDVEAAMVDNRGRRTGRYHGLAEDIPGCRLEAIADDVAEPQDYTFHFLKRGDESYRLLVEPRTEGEVEISVTASCLNMKLCAARADSTLNEGEYQWRLSWRAARDSCHVAIMPVPPKSAVAR